MSLSFAHCRKIAYLGMIGITYGLGLNPILRELNINHCWLCADDAARLAKASEKNSTIDRLDVSWNNICDDGVASLSFSLAGRNSTLTFLNISSNNFGASGAASLAKCLFANYGMKHIELKHNAICDYGATELASAIRANSTLEKLNISDTDIGDAGADAIGKILMISQGMRIVWVAENPRIGTTGIESLRRAARENSSLDGIHFDHDHDIEQEQKCF